MKFLTLSNWAVVLLGLVVNQGVNALVLIVIARQVSPVEYGQYLACYGLASLMIVLPNAGLDAFLLARGSADPANMPRWWQSSVRLRLRLLLLWLGLMILLSFCLAPDTYPLAVLLPVTVGLACDSLTLLSYSALRGLGRHGPVTAAQVLAALLLLGVTLAWPFGSGQIVRFCIFRALLSAIFVAPVGLLVRQFLRQPVGVTPVRCLFQQARPFALADVATAVYMKADLTIVSLFLGSVGASVYGPALSIVNMSFLVPNALYFFMLPFLARSFAADRRRFARVGAAQLGIQALSGMALAAILFWLAPMTIRQVFGSDYASSVLVLKLLSPILVLKSCSFGLAAILTAADLQPWRTAVQVVCALFNTTANLVVIGTLGILGVAMVYLFSEALLLAGYVWAAHRRRVGRGAVLGLAQA
ncbi:MAG: lipopolysaccharide biosynthesis protein [Chloroflexota bacterium]